MKGESKKRNEERFRLKDCWVKKIGEKIEDKLLKLSET